MVRALDLNWRIIELGVYQSSEQYIESILSQGQYVGRVARGFMPHVALESKRVSVGLAKVALDDFDFSDFEVSIADSINSIASENRLNLCRPEVALALRDQYSDQRKPEILWVGTEFLDTGHKHFKYFSLSHENRGRWLTLGCGGPLCDWGKWRRKWFEPETQEKIVPMRLCECPWSRQTNPVYLVFETGYE